MFIDFCMNDKCAAGTGRFLGAASAALSIPLDALENALLWRELVAGASTPLAVTAGVAASLKFLLVVVTAAWCGAALIRRFAQGGWRKAVGTDS